MKSPKKNRARRERGKLIITVRKRKIPRLKSFRCEKLRGAKPSASSDRPSANLEEPRARETHRKRKTSVPHGARVLTKRCWQPGEIPLVTPLMGEFPKHARVVYCDPQAEGWLLCGHTIRRPPIQVGRYSSRRVSPITRCVNSSQKLRRAMLGNPLFACSKCVHLLVRFRGATCRFAKTQTAFRINRIACCPGPKTSSEKKPCRLSFGCCNIVKKVKFSCSQSCLANDRVRSTKESNCRCHSFTLRHW